MAMDRGIHPRNGSGDSDGATRDQDIVTGDVCNLEIIPQLARLPAETLDAMKSMCAIRRFRAGQILLDAGDQPEFFGIVRSGILRLQKTMLDGRQQIVGLMVEGDMFGKVFDGPQQFAVEAATDVEIFTLLRKPFEDLLLRSPELDQVVLVNIMNELDRARDWMIIVANPRVKGRLAGFILFCCTRFASVHDVLQQGAGSAVDVRIPIGRSDLANSLGTRPETISRALHALADDGSIVIKRPDLIEICDFAALGSEAGEEELPTHGSFKELVRSLAWRAA